MIERYTSERKESRERKRMERLKVKKKEGKDGIKNVGSGRFFL